MNSSNGNASGGAAFDPNHLAGGMVIDNSSPHMVASITPKLFHVDPAKIELLESRIMGVTKSPRHITPFSNNSSPFSVPVVSSAANAISIQCSSNPCNSETSLPMEITGAISPGTDSVAPLAVPLLSPIPTAPSAPSRLNHNPLPQLPPLPADEISNASSDRSERGESSEVSRDSVPVTLKDPKTPKQKQRPSKRKLDSSEKRERKINEFFKHAKAISPDNCDSGFLISEASDVRSIETQTEVTSNLMTEQHLRMSSNLEERDSRIQELTAHNQQLTTDLELLQEANRRLEELNKQCIEFNKKLLVEKAENEKKESRRVSLEKRLRLGQFTAVRQGAAFIDQWQDGYAFKDILKRQDSINKDRDDIEKLRKNLLKRKPQPDFKKSQLSPSEFYEQDEILKIRTQVLKKEEADLSTELERLERERNVHIRELKRLQAEDESSFKTYPVLYDRYLLLTLLGKGGFSEVFKSFDLRDQRFVACKIHHVNKQWPEDKRNNYIKHACREYEIHKNLIHPRIVRLFDVFEIDQNSFCTVLEYCDGNDLDFYLKQVKTLPEREGRSIIMQIVSGLKYLNQLKPPVIHYDLKPGNILLGSNSCANEVRITDFGLSKIMDDEHFSETRGGMELTSQGAGTYWYLPPEVFEDSSTGPPLISSKVDVWSIGVLFYQILYGKKPYGHNESQVSILKNDTIRNAGPVEFPAKPPVSSEAKNFIRRCLSRVSVRADVLTLAQDEYLQPPASRKRDFASPSSVSQNMAPPPPFTQSSG